MVLPTRLTRDTSPKPARIPGPFGDEPTSDIVDGTLTALARVAGHVARAARYYRENKPGRAEYELVRAGLLIAQAAADVETADTLADLRFAHLGGTS